MPVHIAAPNVQTLSQRTFKSRSQSSKIQMTTIICSTVAIFPMMRGRTTIIIAHRLATVLKAAAKLDDDAFMSYIWITLKQRREMAMKYKNLGSSGVKVSTLCLGAMMFGAWGNPDHDDSVAIIHAALDAGINFVDTADVYSGGEAETIVGQALAGRRDDVVLSSKCFWPASAFCFWRSYMVILELVGGPHWVRSFSFSFFFLSLMPWLIR